MALDAEVELISPDARSRRVALAQFYRPPGDTPDVETVLRPGETIAQVRVPGGPVARNSTYVKVRDRTSFAFALVSAAVALDIDGDRIRGARVALGGVGPMPWRLPHVEDALRDKPATAETFRAAAARAGEGATGSGGNDFKIELARRTVLRGLRMVAERENL